MAITEFVEDYGEESYGEEGYNMPGILATEPVGAMYAAVPLGSSFVYEKQRKKAMGQSKSKDRFVARVPMLVQQVEGADWIEEEDSDYGAQQDSDSVSEYYREMPVRPKSGQGTQLQSQLTPAFK